MNRVYPWHRLRKPGDSFIWRDRRLEQSLRSQATKQGRKRRVVFSVRVESATALRVTYEHGVL